MVYEIGVFVGVYVEVGVSNLVGIVIGVEDLVWETAIIVADAVISVTVTVGVDAGDPPSTHATRPNKIENEKSKIILTMLKTQPNYVGGGILLNFCRPNYLLGRTIRPKPLF